MANGKVMFKAEVKRIRELRDALGMSTRLNGGQVILGESNQAILKEVAELLDKAAFKLNEII